MQATLQSCTSSALHKRQLNRGGEDSEDTNSMQNLDINILASVIGTYVLLIVLNCCHISSLF
jgi:hypothetical protein